MPWGACRLDVESCEVAWPLPHRPCVWVCGEARLSFPSLPLPCQVERTKRESGGSPVPTSRRLLAVPFLGKDTPSLASEFSHPDVLISLTILAYSHEGLRDTDVRPPSIAQL